MKLVESSSEAGDSASPERSAVSVRVTHTLRDVSGDPRAVASLGIDGTTGKELVVLASEVGSHVEAPAHVFFEPLTTDPIVNLLIPLVARSLDAMEAANVQPGWTAHVLGCNLPARIHAEVCNWGGARSVLSQAGSAMLEQTDIGGPSEHVFFLFGVTNRELSAVLSAAPDLSTVVISDLTPGDPLPISFYGSMHRRGVDLLAPNPKPRDELMGRAASLLKERPITDALSLGSFSVETGTADGSGCKVIDWPS